MFEQGKLQKAGFSALQLHGPPRVQTALGFWVCCRHSSSVVQLLHSPGFEKFSAQKLAPLVVTTHRQSNELTVVELQLRVVGVAAQPSSSAVQMPRKGGTGLQVPIRTPPTGFRSWQLSWSQQSASLA